MRGTYKEMLIEQKARDGVQDLERVYVLFDKQEMNYIKTNAVVLSLPFTTVVRLMVREHYKIQEAVR